MKKNKQDIYWMHQAIRLAKNAQTLGEIPVGAVLISDNELIIAESWNHTILDYDPCAHAEILTLRAGGQQLQNYRLPNTTLYVTLEPCIMCAGAMIYARIRRLVYGAYSYKSGAAGSVLNIFNDSYINHHIQVSGGILATECSIMLSSFFKYLRIEKTKKTIPKFNFF